MTTDGLVFSLNGELRWLSSAETFAVPINDHLTLNSVSSPGHIHTYLPEGLKPEWFLNIVVLVTTTA